jgi:hypothetical protein
VHRIGPGPVLQSPTTETFDHAPLRQLPPLRCRPTAPAAADQPPHAFRPPHVAHAIIVPCCLSTAESVGDSKPSCSLRSPLLASPFTSAMLQHPAGRATPRRPPRAPPELGPPPRTIGRRSEPTTGHPVPSCSSPAAALPVSAFFIHSPAWPTQPPAPPESQEHPY